MTSPDDTLDSKSKIICGFARIQKRGRKPPFHYLEDLYMTGKYRFDPNADLSERDLGHVLKLLLDQHIFNIDDMERLPLEVRGHFTECLPDEFE